MKRYRRTNPWGGIDNGMEPAADGDWVKFEDAKELEALLPYLADGCGCSHMKDDGIPGKCVACRARDLMKKDSS